MNTSAGVDEVGAVGARVTDTMLYITLNDGREIGAPLSLPSLKWLAEATLEQRANWHLEPRGFAVYWEDLDDGVEVAHLLALEPLTA